jgi:hypothetical protein
MTGTLDDDDDIDDVIDDVEDILAGRMVDGGAITKPSPVPCFTCFRRTWGGAFACVCTYASFTWRTEIIFIIIPLLN